MDFTARTPWTVPGTEIKSSITGMSFGEQQEYEKLSSDQPGKDADEDAREAWSARNSAWIRKAVLAHWLTEDGSAPLVTAEILDSKTGPTPGQFYGAWEEILKISMVGAESLGARFRNGRGEGRGDAAQAAGGDVRGPAERAPGAAGG